MVHHRQLTADTWAYLVQNYPNPEHSGFVERYFSMSPQMEKDGYWYRERYLHDKILERKLKTVIEFDYGLAISEKTDETQIDAEFQKYFASKKDLQPLLEIVVTRVQFAKDIWVDFCTWDNHTFFFSVLSLAKEHNALGKFRDSRPFPSKLVMAALSQKYNPTPFKGNGHLQNQIATQKWTEIPVKVTELGPNESKIFDIYQEQEEKELLYDTPSAPKLKAQLSVEELEEIRKLYADSTFDWLFFQDMRRSTVCWGNWKVRDYWDCWQFGIFGA